MIITLDRLCTDEQMNDIKSFSGGQNVGYNIINKSEDRQFKQEVSTIDVNGNAIGGEKIIVMAGPCAVDSEERLFSIAKDVSEAGGKILRGGVFKPRTSPYSFQGLGNEGLEMLLRVKKKTGLSIITEVMDATQIERVQEVADIIQIGARNMHNYTLLQEVGKCKKTVLLKRGFCATVHEWLMAAEYILKEGNKNVILCERGIRTFESSTRNTLDLSSIVQVKMGSHLPIIVDPSHGTGRREMVLAMSRAAIAAGADGLLIEADIEPEEAISDGDQTISTKELKKLILDVGKIAEVVGRKI